MDKLYVIIITAALNMPVSAVLNKLGFGQLKYIGEVNFTSAQKIDKGVCIAKVDDKIVIVSPDSVFNFYEEDTTAFEKKVCEAFPHSEIAALTLYDVAELYGYAIIRSGKRVRAKEGAEGKTYLDAGERLPEEDAIDKTEIFSPQELDAMKSFYSRDEIEISLDNEKGVRVVKGLLEKYLGNDESKISNIMLAKYQ